MLIKLDTLDFTLENIEENSVQTAKAALTKSDWVKLDRMVMALIFVVAIVGSLIF